MRRTTRQVIPVLMLLSALPQIAFAQPYTFVPIVLPPNRLCTDGRRFEAVPTAMNNRDQIVGYTRPECDECCLVEQRYFLWGPTDGLRLIDLPFVGNRPYVGIDDAGVIWSKKCATDGTRTCRPIKWVDGVVTEVPLPPGGGSTSIGKVLRNGTVLMTTVQTDGGGTSWWSFDRGTYTKLFAPSSVKIQTANGQGVIGGCRSLDSGGDGRAHLRFPDGRTIEPWPTTCEPGWPEGVTVLGALGHFAGFGLVRKGSAVLPPVWYTHYGTLDGRLWTAKDVVALYDMNNDGTLLSTSFTFREGTLTDLRLSTVNWPSCSPEQPPYPPFVPAIINDHGAIAGQHCGNGVAVLVPDAPAPPAALAVSVTGRVVTLTWTVSLGASEYFIEAGSAPGLANLYSASVGNHLSLTTPAPPGQYYVRVRARSPSGTSRPSNEVVIAVP